ncbi:MAG: hypothetical protein ACE3JP_14040 [Ectobacillus sp.]
MQITQAFQKNIIAAFGKERENWLKNLLVNHLHTKANSRYLLKYRVDTLCNEPQLERWRLLRATIALAALYACWGIEDGDLE